MNSLRKLVGFLMVLLLAAFALPASAAPPPTKQYGLDITRGAPPGWPATGNSAGTLELAVGGEKVYWTISNQTPTGGNSAIGSFVIKKAPGVKITNPAGAVFDLVALAATGDLKVSGFGPLTPKQDSGTHQVTISFDLTPEDPCADVTTVWAGSSPSYVVVTTGNFSSTTFVFTNTRDNGAVSNQTTKITGGVCIQPTGKTDPSTLGNLVSCTKVLVPSTSTCTAQATSGYFLSAFSSNCTRVEGTNTCTIPVPDGSPLEVTGYYVETQGTVGCLNTNNYYSNTTGTTVNSYIDPNKTYVDLDQVTSGDYGIRRGNNYNTPTSSANCTLVGVNLTKSGNRATFLYDKTTGQLGAFKYWILWDEVTVASGWTDKRLEFCYGKDADGNDLDCSTGSGWPKFMPALQCADDDLTLPPEYLLPIIPYDAPFNDIANEHDQYKPGVRAKACVAMTVTMSNGRSNPSDNGSAIKAIYGHKIVDESDLTMRISE